MTAIAIFVKTPGYSSIKTRLARDVGQAKAEQWHRLAAEAVAKQATKAAIGPVYFAVAEPEARNHPLWSSLPTLDQGEGGLGERMHHVHNHLIEEHGSALLLGADTIQWQPDWLQQADRWLENTEPRLCIGPARDGGFWTFGSNCKIDRAAWISVRYSRADTLTEFIGAMHDSGPDSGQWMELPRLTDLDELSDIQWVLDELSQPTRRSTFENDREIRTFLETLSNVNS